MNAIVNTPDAVEAATLDLIARGCEIARRSGVSASFPVTNPATGALIANVADMGAVEAEAAVARAAAAFPAWSGRTAKERSIILRRWHALIVANLEPLARILTLEQGKPLAEARAEITFGSNFIEWFAEECKRAYGDVIPNVLPDRRCLVFKQAIGVVGAITPWNFPSAMITRKVSPALAAGCTIVVKPGEDTPLSALALAVLAEDAGFPVGVFAVLTAARPAAVAGVLTASPLVRKISFTGSTRVGKLLLEQCAGTVKKMSLELGGNAPFIVFDDADLETAVQAAIAVKFRNAGQTCVSANRIYVQRGVLDAFAQAYAKAVGELAVGDGLAAETRVGPLINAAAKAKVSNLVADALAKGAAAVLGGEAEAMAGNFYAPTILTGVTPVMDIATQEIFGPVAALQPFEDEAQVLRLANDTPFGLASYVYTQDLARIWRMSEGLEYGMVGINDILASNEATPFGGIKESGVGREGSRYGLEDFMEIKYVSIGGIAPLA